jgi:four helix bundle protein
MGGGRPSRRRGDPGADGETRRWGEWETLFNMARIASYKELRVYQAAMDAVMHVFELTRKFPVEERYSMVDQIRRSSRSVCANIGEAWSKRRYRAHFISKLSNAESEAAETRVWLELAVTCPYLKTVVAEDLDKRYDNITGQIVRMLTQPGDWTIK